MTSSNPVPATCAEARSMISAATLPQDIFGSLSGMDASAAEKKIKAMRALFRRLAMLVHPDRNPELHGDHAYFAKLESLHNDAVEICRRAMGILPPPKEGFPITFQTRRNQYALLSRKASGSMRGIFAGESLDSKKVSTPVFVKVPHSSKDNDLMQREAEAFGVFQRKLEELRNGSDKDQSAAKYFGWHFVRFIETIQLKEPGGSKPKLANAFVMDGPSDWYSLEEIRNAYPQGVPTRAMVFMMNRILETLIFTHDLGIVHNALTPNHVMIHLPTHRSHIIDWTNFTSTKDRQPPPYMDEDRYEGYYAPEMIETGGITSTASDIYMAACTMVFMLGGDPKEMWIPKHVESPIRDFLDRCLQPKRKLRPSGAAQALQEFQGIVESLFGPRKFFDLAMPAKRA